MGLQTKDLAARIEAVCAMVDELYRVFETVSREKLGKDLAAARCARGCTFCCHIEVAASVSQVIALKRFMERERPGILERLKTRIRHRRREIGNQFGPARRVACPLLGDDGACTVYEGRPLSCRALLSFDVEKCREGFESPGSPVKVPHSTAAMRMKADLVPQLVAGERQLGLAPGRYELIRALYLAFQTPDFERRCLAGEDVLREARIPAAGAIPAGRPRA